MRYENVLIHEGVAHDANPPGPGSGRYPWGSGERVYQHIDRVITDDTIKLDDLKTKPTAKVNEFINSSNAQEISNTKIQQNANVGKEQIRVKNPSGNGTIPLYQKVRQHDNQGYAWNTTYPDIKRQPFKIESDIGKSTSRIFKSVDSTVKELMKYNKGQLDDKARKRLDRKIKRMSDEELEAVAKRFSNEYRTINAINDRNKITVPAGQDRVTTMANILGDHVNTALGVIGIISAIRKMVKH